VSTSKQQLSLHKPLLFFGKLIFSFLPGTTVALVGLATSLHSISVMHSLTITIALAISALAPTSLAAPAQVKRGTSFTVNQGPEKPYQAGPVILQKAYSKYNKIATEAVQKAASNGSVTATPEQYDAEYLCPVTIGGQTLNLDFDTGSADL
jgi:aspergillopepsin I